MTLAMWRPWIFWVGGIILVMVPFLIFAYGTGWPPHPDSCIPQSVVDALKANINALTDSTAVATDFKTNNTCYCENFDPAATLSWSKHVRQPFNTWLNLYAIITSLVVVIYIMLDRRAGNGRCVIRSNSVIAEFYVFAVLFLGLGSMWFHGSMSASVSWLDGMSMYVYAGFLVWYTLDRALARNGKSPQFRIACFFIGYGLTVAAFTLIAVAGLSSVILIGLLVAAFLYLEFFQAGFIADNWAIGYFVSAIVLIGAAIAFWVASQTGKPLCNPDSAFQPHGWLWHPLAGLMAVMMYFYWRREDETQAIYLFEWRRFVR